MFQDLSRRLIKPGFGRFKPQLKFFKFHLSLIKKLLIIFDFF